MDLSAMRRRSSLITERLRELDRELAQRRLRASSNDQRITVTVDGNGTLVGIDIADSAVRRSHPHLIGPAVVTTVAAARAAASRDSESRTRDIIDSVAGPPQATDQSDMDLPRFDGTTWGAP
jgi:DNA-binding protein YbaB